MNLLSYSETLNVPHNPIRSHAYHGILKRTSNLVGTDIVRGVSGAMLPRNEAFSIDRECSTKHFGISVWSIV
ncbi:hypothetical protein ABTA68_20045, partial [Acinetobacter baumannii]